MASKISACLAACLGGAVAGPCDGACKFLSDERYCPVNDVREHADSNKDVAAVAARLKETPPNYAAAKAIYTDGLHSTKGGGVMRTLQGFAQKDQTVGGKYTNVFYSGAIDLYGSTDAIWDGWIVACLDATGPCAGKSDDFRKYVINKGLIGVVTAYVTYEMGAAIWKAADGQTADGGAPYNWDEAAAFHIGRKDLDLSLYTIGGTTTPGILYSPWEFNWKRDADFPDGVMTHAHAPPIFNHGLVNLRGNSYDPIAVEAAQKEMYNIYAITAIRSAIKYGWKAYGGGTFSDKYLAEGALYWRSASGYLSTFNKTTVQEIDAIFDLSRTTFTEQDACNVKTKVESLYLAAGISCAEVGTWKDVVADTCLDTACTPSGNDTLSDGSTDYVAGCVADAGETTTAEPGATTAQEVSQALTAHLSGAFLVAVAAIFA